jgi:VanZ family protein
MNYLYHLITKYPFSCFIIAVIWIICLIPIPENPLSEVRMIDKWTHVAMYGGLCIVIWIEYLRHHCTADWTKLLIGAVLAPALMGGLVEIVQATCTGGRRSGDWLDFAADAIGVAAGLFIGLIIKAMLSSSTPAEPRR